MQVLIQETESDPSAFCSSNGFSIFFHLFSYFFFFIIRNLRIAFPLYIFFSSCETLHPSLYPFFCIWLRIEGYACLGSADQRTANITAGLKPAAHFAKEIHHTYRKRQLMNDICLQHTCVITLRMAVVDLGGNHIQSNVLLQS